MKTQRRIFLILLILAAAVSGCSLGGGGEPERAVLQPLNAADWPTPPPPTPLLTPTPFPKVTLAPTATPTARPAVEPTATPAGVSGLSFSGDTGALVEQVTALSGGLSPVAAGLVTVDGVTMRQGPGPSYPAIDQVARDEPAGILGRNGGGDWLYVLTLSLKQGWLPANSLRVIGSLAEAPVLPADPLAAAAEPGAPPAPAQPETPAVARPLDPADLAAVATATVRSEALNLRQGPGAAYGSLDTLAGGDAVTVLALNKTGDWALVRTAAGDFGWVSLEFLAVDGSLAAAPQVVSPAPGRDLPPGQVAPIFEPEAATSAVPARAGGTGGTLVIQLSSGGDIVAINADGSGLRRLTQGIDPALSPDGQTVAFTRWDNVEDGSLWLIDVDGGNERAVVGGMRQAKGPAWSPDGSRIVLNYQHGGRLEEKKQCVNLIELGDKNPNIPFNATDVGTEIRDGLPFLCWKVPPDPHWGLRLVDLADGSARDLYGGMYAFRPAWDPSRTWRIVSDAGNGLLETDVNREYFQNITTQIGDGSPAFSPDGRYLAVAVNQHGQFDIHRLNADGSGRVRLTETPPYGWALVGPDKQEPWDNVAPAWSPDGAQIAYLTNRTGRWEVWVMNADGSNQRPLFPEAVNDRLAITYNYVDERVLSWR